ncbi:MAG TPA: HEAT repeat domain-containing protein [Phycisphaerae bacterium]|nr:HEAT repeat domain-containing protein [Phycisphaerae bacterium]
MMHLRRRWLPLALLSTSLASLTPLVAHAVDVQAEAKTMESATPEQAVQVRNDVLRDAPTGVLDRDKYGSNVCHAFAHIISDPKNPDAALNSAILVAKLGTLSTDATLEAMLKNPDPAIRYWAAKGLEGIMPTLAKLPSAQKEAISALTDAQTAEKSDIVKSAIARALHAAGK